ncbi:2-C-methyl-D-erythritol 4-phosphate cytidylyltransferase [Candidatus Saccharibacteria bacterium TM7i]|nr:2-C-methyl-D-erythritol 4-phosphate cytidylyltransferase [Candidatus Saccharibacteria bacterium TM7i]
MNVAVLTAGGVGSRLNNNIPKQFLTVNDVPIIIYTLRQFQKNKDVDKIIVACLEDWKPALNAYKREYDIDKLEWIVNGGETGAESIVNCLDALKKNLGNEDVTVIIHDGNRPLVSSDVIKSALLVKKEYGNAIACLPSNEVLLELNNANDNSSNHSINRDVVRRTQTPHVFSLDDIRDKYSKAMKNGIHPVAPCDAVIINNERVYLSEGSELNFKVTTQGDLKILRALIESGV